MTWLITGGSGQLGIALSEELDSRGLIFTAFSSKDLDITQDLIVRDLISQVSPTVIINCAAWTDVDGAETNEVLKLLLAARQAKEHGVREHSNL